MHAAIDLWERLLDGMRPAVFGLVVGLAASLEAAG
jgi:hypothetical protein